MSAVDRTDGPDSGCWMKVGFISEERYCGRHGRAAGWPCTWTPPVPDGPDTALADAFAYFRADPDRLTYPLATEWSRHLLTLARAVLARPDTATGGGSSNVTPFPPRPGFEPHPSALIEAILGDLAQHLTDNDRGHGDEYAAGLTCAIDIIRDHQQFGSEPAPVPDTATGAALGTDRQVREELAELRDWLNLPDDTTAAEVVQHAKATAGDVPTDTVEPHPVADSVLDAAMAVAHVLDDALADLAMPHEMEQDAIRVLTAWREAADRLPAGDTTGQDGAP